MTGKSILGRLAILAVLALGAAAAAAKAPVPRTVVPRGPLAADETATVEIFRKWSPSVVHITTLDKVVNLWTMNVREVPRGTGSGFVWDDQGHIVTNYHVVAGARGAQVRLSDQRTFAAELVGVSPENDLAVLRIRVPEKRPEPLVLGSSRDLLVGQRVVAIGNPFGLDHTLTTGVISALDRSIDGEGGAIHHLIQTDAAINPGNSGGPLLDSAGRLIGVNTAIYSPSGASAGIGFAVQADKVNRVVPELIAFGQYRPPSMGITVLDRVGSAVTRQLGIKGALILEVAEGSPADRAGLKGSRLVRAGSIVPGDVIQSLDGKPVEGSSDLDKLLDGRNAGDRITLGVWREGATRQVTVTLAAGGR
ncbi:MAG: trypsin-like peptidase domain-containing protein [Rhodocyclaceae bacterium]|nr:trypsin-like peptidase domain-containing protein [Rhodocyclaceae bacterium]